MESSMARTLRRSEARRLHGTACCMAARCGNVCVICCTTCAPRARVGGWGGRERGGDDATGNHDAGCGVQPEITDGFVSRVVLPDNLQLPPR